MSSYSGAAAGSETHGSHQKLNPTQTNKCHNFISWLVTSVWFNIGMMTTILLSSITIAIETTSLRDTVPLFFTITDYIFLAIFTIEFIFKIYSEPLRYWKNGYNLFDFFLLIISGVQTILSSFITSRTSVQILRATRVLRAFRIFKIVSFIQGLQVLVSALLSTLLNAIIPLLFLLFILMFIFSVMGYYWFGYDRHGDTEKWGSFGNAMLSLFTFVTVDGWTDIQGRLVTHGYQSSEVFTIVFILLGHFLFTNLFIGVIIWNIHTAAKKAAIAKKSKRDQFIKNKVAAIIQKQHKDVLRVQERQIKENFKNFQEMTKEFQKTLRHDDFTYSTDLCTSKPWIDTFMTSLTHLENSKYRVRKIYLELAQTLSKINEEQTLETASRVTINSYN